ncbi:MAG TPA: biotin--[acetyl-CoA-carboxylase] ligase [Nocardioidaceae bacterium]|nr:biotin--[acetyl-CoA-carboxylase] ligase [Nocardioidaceae bacterium]
MDSPYSDLDRPPLDRDVLAHALTSPAGRWREIVVVDRIDSTNAEVAARARRGEEEGLVFVAESQVGGRGRLGRVWAAPPRSGLTVSVLLRPSGVAPTSWPWLPLLTGVAVAEAVGRISDLAPQLKWPNDVLVDDRKLAGILLERVDTPGGAAAVVGIGLNVSLRAAERPVPSATSLALEGVRAPDRTIVLREVLRVFGVLYDAWVAAGGDAAAGLADAYTTRCSTIGRDVRVEAPAGGAVRGRALRIDLDGRLVVGAASGEVAVSAGDVVHLR